MGRRIAIIGAVLLACASVCMAQEEKKQAPEKIRQTKVLKQVQGEISAIGKRYISIVFSRDEALGEEEEIMIPFNSKNVKLNYMRHLSEVQVGDIVNVQYEETETKGQGKDRLTFEAKVIGFVKKAQKKVKSADVLDSKNSLPQEQEE